MNALIHTVDDRQYMRVTTGLLKSLAPMTGAHPNVKEGLVNTCEALSQALDKIDTLEAALVKAETLLGAAYMETSNKDYLDGIDATQKARADRNHP